jgi:NAD(P)H-hydrate repair Nnr-like enzyme with NAD(P)H-hydrate dehydratase domain
VGAWVIGSGTDAVHRTPDEERALRDILSGAATVVVDAGALDLAPTASAPLVVTPHAGEFARLRDLLGLRSKGTDDRVVDVAETARALGRTVLLKGATTLVAAFDGSPVLSVASAPAWLATAGAGDVLAGVIGALLAAAPDESIAEVAASGAWLHGHAAMFASGSVAGAPGHPIVALDVAEALPAAIEDLLS